jgi:hypothetical protein
MNILVQIFVNNTSTSVFHHFQDKDILYFIFLTLYFMDKCLYTLVV